jgi:hypothetical protein
MIRPKRMDLTQLGVIWLGLELGILVIVLLKYIMFIILTDFGCVNNM